MVKFYTIKDKEVKDPLPSDSESNNDDFTIDIKITKIPNKSIRIGKFTFDETTITRIAIVKLASIGYKIKEISKILKISRMLEWKWKNYDKFKGKGDRKSKFNDEEKNIYVIKLKERSQEKMEFHPEF